MKIRGFMKLAPRFTYKTVPDRKRIDMFEFSAQKCYRVCLLWFVSQKESKQ